MKILIDARLYGLENAGLGRYALNLIDQIWKIDKENEYILLLRKKYFDELSLPKNFKKILADFRHYSFREQMLLPRIIFSEKPDLVHFLHFNVPVWFKGKFVVTIHDLLMHKQKGKDATTLALPFYLIKKHGYKAVFKKAVMDAKKIIVPSNAVKDEITDFYKIQETKVVVTNEAVDNNLKTKNISESHAKKMLEKYELPEKYFLHVGNAYPHKNLKRAIEAARVSGSFLAIVSSRSEFTQRLEDLIKTLHAQENVKLLGFVPDEELYVLYKYSVGYLFASLSEGFGLPGLEAMKIGTLLLASEIPVFKEVYKDNAIYFNPFDFSDIARKMEDVKEMPAARRKEIIAKAQKFVNTYSWQKMAEETLQIYNDAVKQ